MSLSNLDTRRRLTAEQLKYIMDAPTEQEQTSRYLETRPKPKPPLAIMSSQSIAYYDQHGTAHLKPPRQLHRKRIIRFLDWLSRKIDPAC